MANSDKRDKKAESSAGALVRSKSEPDEHDVNLVAAAGWNLGAAARTLADGLDRLTELLNPVRKERPRKPAEPIEPLLEQLGRKVSGRKKDLAALSEDDEFWDLLERLVRQRRPKAPALPAAAEESPAENEEPKPAGTEPAAEAEGFEDPLAGVLDDEEEESGGEGDGEAEETEESEGDKGRGKKKGT